MPEPIDPTQADAFSGEVFPSGGEPLVDLGERVVEPDVDEGVDVLGSSR